MFRRDPSIYRAEKRGGVYDCEECGEFPCECYDVDPDEEYERLRDEDMGLYD